MTNNLTVVGDGGPSGSYALGIKVAEPVTMALGTQKKYAKIGLQGDMVYLGAARAEKGFLSLNQRLNWHTTRSGKRSPHPIRENVRQTLFEDRDWERLLPNGKKHRWEIDWLLDHKQVVLKRITALQHPKDLDIEHSLAVRLDGDFQTHIIEKGLGAQDWKDGFDHLLRVSADEVWWQLLSVRMEALACEIPTGAQVTELVESYLRGRFCLNQLSVLGNDAVRAHDFRSHPTVEELVAAQQQIEDERQSKLEKMHKVQVRKCRGGESSGVLRLYDFPQITEDRLLNDAKLAQVIERLRETQGDSVLEVVFSLQTPQTREAIEQLGMNSGIRWEGETMANKKPTKKQALTSLGPQPQTGRKPTKPKTVDARLEQLIKQSEAWIRLVQESWFDPDDPLIERAIGSTEHPELPATYDEAILSIQWLKKFAEVAEEKLLNGKREAERKLKEAKE